ncbi:FIMAH domain-containing protein [Virgibacillus salexigens]
MVEDVQTAIEEWDDRSAFEGDAKGKLLMHLTAVAQYEEQGQAAKVRKHLNGFKLLLDQQKEEQNITEAAYKSLMDYTNDMMNQWK